MDNKPIERPKRYRWTITVVVPGKKHPATPDQEYTVHGHGTSISSVMTKARVYLKTKLKLKEEDELIIKSMVQHEHLEF
jgi:hypothetical protein